MSNVHGAQAFFTQIGFLASPHWALVVHSTQVFVPMLSQWGGVELPRAVHSVSFAQPLQVCVAVSQIGLASGQSLLARHGTQT
jgi:hypothetical protein